MAGHFLYKVVKLMLLRLKPTCESGGLLLFVNHASLGP